MKSASLIIFLARAFLVASSALDLHLGSDLDLFGLPRPMVQITDLEAFRRLEERIPTIHLGTFSLEYILPPTDTLIRM